MSYGVWSLVIFLTFAVGMLGIWVLIDRGNDQLERTRLLARLEEDTGRVELEQSYGEFPVDTGPLLIVSETTAAGDALEREIRLRCVEAEAKIPARWRS